MPSFLSKLKLDFISILLNLKVVEKLDEENKKNNEVGLMNNPKCLLTLMKNQKISRNDRCEATGKKFKNCLIIDFGTATTFDIIKNGIYEGGVIAPGIKLSIKNLIELSDKFYANGFSGMKFIPLRTRLAIFFAAKIYKGIGEKIKSGGYVYKLERIYLNKLEKLWITIISIPEFLFLKNIFKSYKPIRGSFKNENI